MAQINIPKLTELPASAAGKVLSSEEYQALADAAHALDVVKREAMALNRRTVEDARDAGQRQAERESAEMLLKTRQEIEQYISGLESKLVAIVTDLVTRVIGETDSLAAVSGMVAQALGTLRGEDNIIVRVSPAQADGVREKLSQMDLSAEHISPEQFEVVADAGMEDGACRLETAGSWVETSLDEQLQRIKDALAPASASATAEDAPVMAEDVPAMPEDAPALAEYDPAMAEDTPVMPEDDPATPGEAPAPPGDAPAPPGDNSEPG